jgi:hypothetical protein
MPMPLISVISGLLLIGVGVAGYTLAEAESAKTALIPAAVGLLIALSGGLAVAKPGARKHAMHAAAAISLLGLLAAGGRLAMVLALGKGSPLGRSTLAAMTVICAVFLILCIKSFIDARRNRA